MITPNVNDGRVICSDERVLYVSIIPRNLLKLNFRKKEDSVECYVRTNP